MEKTSDAAEKARLQARMADATERATHHSSSSKNDAPKASKGPKVNTKSNDPLGGLDL
jgi:hypothetical protein